MLYSPQCAGLQMERFQALKRDTWCVGEGRLAALAKTLDSFTSK